MDDTMDNVVPITSDTSATSIGDASAPDTSAQSMLSGEVQQPQAQPQQLQQPQAQPQQAQPQPQAAPKSKWEQILMGALVGMAGGAGAKNFGQGVAGGANASLQYGQMQKNNDARQQQLDMEKQRMVIAQQTAADLHATAQQNMAVSQANLAVLHTQYSMMPKTVQEQLDRADMSVGQTLKSEGVPVVTGQDGVSYQDAQQRIMAERTANPNNALQYIMHTRPDGKYDVFQVTNPSKTNDNAVDVTIGYDVNSHKPITKHYEPHQVTLSQITNLETNAASNYVNAVNGLEEFKRKNAVTVGGEIQVAKAKQQMDSSPVYAVNGQGDTILTTKAAAIQSGMTAIRAVKQADINKDQHDIKVLSDIQTKSNNVAQAAAAMDKTGWMQTAAVSKYLAENPNTTANSLLKSGVMSGMNPKAKAYVISILSLREASMGMQKLLTGTARTNETQLGALMNTLPGVEPDSATVGQKLDAFDQNLGLLAKGLPKGTGVELAGFNKKPQPIYAAAPGKPRLMSVDGGQTWTPATQ